MNVTIPEQDSDRRRTNARRTAWILFACAIGSYLLFLYSALHKQ
jgi:hypothetical protein